MTSSWPLSAGGTRTSPPAYAEAGEMLAEKAKLVFKVNAGAAVLGLGYIVGLKYASIICAGSLAVWWIIIPGMSAIWGDSVLNAWNPGNPLLR